MKSNYTIVARMTPKIGIIDVFTSYFQYFNEVTHQLHINHEQLKSPSQVRENTIVDTP